VSQSFSQSVNQSIGRLPLTRSDLQWFTTDWRLLCSMQG